ncbi:hypothetical protein FHY30_001848 [Xanthomonas arboricola]|uniref:hypothetical protein n=1 Tax=Xanthomonas campestris TaxID=339 RepID=UPI0012901CBC|nr:hypothetical protein [Xanthomonas campestris]MCW2003093.1 hypothetical protein [Xanthomonas campestris]
MSEFDPIKIEKERSWKALSLMRELLSLSKPIAQDNSWSSEERSVLAMLFIFSARSTESSLLLSSYGQLWDAEMVLRAVVESSLKVAYILQSKEDFKDRITEYSVDHFNISLLKDDSKVRATLAALPDPESITWLPFREMLLSEARRDELNFAYDKTKRRSIESRWGVGGILNSLRQQTGTSQVNFDSMLHNYSLSSHIQHADYIGVSLPYDRESREPINRDTLELAHLSRIISDAFALLVLRITSGYRFLGIDLQPIYDAQNRIQELEESFGDVYGNWMKVEYNPPPSSG